MAAPLQDMKSLIVVEPEAVYEADRHITDRLREDDIFSLGLRFFKYDKLDIALAFFHKVLEMNENNAQAYANIGSIYHKRGDIESAANFWKYALKIDPSVEKAYINLGNYYFQKGNIDQAISYWTILQTLNPEESTILLNLGVAYEEKKNYLMANHYYEKFIKKGTSHKNGSGYGKAIQRMSIIKKHAKDSFRVGLKHQLKKNYLKALKAYVILLEAYPNHTKANLNAGSICYMYDKYEDAVKFWKRVVYLEPQNKKNMVNLAIAYDRIEQFSYSYCLFRRYLRETEDEKTFESLKIEERIKELEEKLGDKNSYYSTHFSKAEDSLKKKDYFDAYFEYINCSMIKSDSEELGKKIESIEDTLYPERKAVIKYIEHAKKAFKRLELITAVELFKQAKEMDKEENHTQEINEGLYKCAKLIKRAQANQED